MVLRAALLLMQVMREVQSSSSRHGFSFIELMMVLALLVILAGLAAPRYNNAASRYRLELAARRIVHDMSLAQARARSLGAASTVSFDVAAARYQLPGEKHLDRSSTTYTVDLAADPYRVSIGTADFGGTTTLIFNGYGVPAAGGTVHISDGSVTRIISIESDSGAVSVQ